MENWLNIIGWLLSVVTATGNGFVVFLVAKHRRLHSSPNWFVLSLAVADFGVGVAVFPLSYFCNYSMACNSRMQMAFFWFFLHSSVTNLCVLTWNRYIAITHPLRYVTSLSERRPGLIISAAWLIAFAFSLLLLVGMYITTSETAGKVFLLTGVSTFQIISCVLLSYAVVRILVVARAQSHQETAIELQVQSNLSKDAISEGRKSRRRRSHVTACFIIALVLLFLVCYIVVNLLVFCINFSCFSSEMSDNAGQAVICLLVLNSAVNPLVYAFLKKDIKMEINKVLCKEN